MQEEIDGPQEISNEAIHDVWQDIQLKLFNGFSEIYREGASSQAYVKSVERDFRLYMKADQELCREKGYGYPSEDLAARVGSDNLWAYMVATIPEMAKAIDISREAVRQELIRRSAQRTQQIKEGRNKM